MYYRHIMELWLLVVASICVYVSLHSLLSLLFQAKKLPPSPPTIPILGNLLWLLKSSKNFSDMEPVLRQLSARYGPIITLYIGSRPSIFITSHDAAHRALVGNSTLFASRPSALKTTQILTSNQHTVASAAYGSLWRHLRHNFMSVLHPSKLKTYSPGRKWALNVLKDKLLAEADDGHGQCVEVLDHFQFAMFCLLVYMCFGEKLEEDTIKEIELVQRPSVVNFIRFNVLNFMPALGKIVFYPLWKELLKIRQDQKNVLLPLIKARGQKQQRDEKECIISYADTLLNLQVSEEDNGKTRKLTDEEMVSLCSEFINGGTDTSTTTLQWVMANLVKHQDIQEKLVKEINRVVKLGEEIKEEDLAKMPYLKAVVLETLRRHPPGHFILPRAVTEENTILDGYYIPKNAIVNFTVADMAWDASVWKDPMEFKPERFLINDNEVVAFDIKGVREIKMMPFGAGRRVCPAITVAMLHQEYFVANLIRDFKWMAADGDDVDLTEKQDFTMVMKNPLRACISPR